MSKFHGTSLRHPSISVLLLIFITMTLTLSACSDKEKITDTNYDYGSRQHDDPKMNGGKAYGSIKHNATQHENKYMKYDDELSKKVSNLPGVATATVITTDKNAYVAFLLNLSASGTRSNKEPEEQVNTEGYQQQYIAKHDKINDPEQIAKHFNSNFTVSNHHNISPELKQTIAIEVRRATKGIQEVHISANMDFVNQFFIYAKEARAQKQLDPHLRSFNTLVREQFLE
ncbi:YhcN/YlaJ family sporulation lipoprotein [Paenibacillus yanchengensis]|uniref:YhcN/YlaJ family sporulation lipoprotein n=1 Tax=Paenibacillus yanchengensis TaxID=2035833 RepID=A0ABW4YIW1_9BACL